MAENRTVTLPFLLACLLTASVALGAEPGSSEGAAAGDPASNPSFVSSLKSDEPHTPDTDQRLSSADRHLTVGKQFYFRGDLQNARREFDLAVDALLNAPENVPDRRRIERKLDEVSDLIYRFDVEKLGAGQTS